jgi:imidazolonepropionase-like amidohydrolase
MLGGPLSHSEVQGVAAIADSPDEVRLRAREQLRQGASQIKLMAGGGVNSPYNPIESTQFTEAEIRAAVEAAESWGTYVTVHAHTPRVIRQAVAAGFKCIEHGHLIDDPTVKLLAENGIWWSLQPLTYDAAVFARMNPVSQRKALEVFAGTENATGWRSSTRSRRLGVPIFCLMRGRLVDRERTSLRWFAGTRRLKRSRWPPQTMAN